MATASEVMSESMGKEIMTTRKKRWLALPSSWSELPNDLLCSILMRLRDFVEDFCAFSNVCKAWEAAAKASEKEYMASRPPNLMSHHFGDFEFKNIISDPPDYRTRHLNVSSKYSYVGFSFGHLIMVDNPWSERFMVIINPLSGATIHLPTFPKRSYSFNTAALSAPPTSSDCVILGLGKDQDTTLAICPLNGKNRFITLGWTHGYTYKIEIIDRKVFALTNRSGLVIMDLVIRPTLRVVQVQCIQLPDQMISRRTDCTVLGQLGGEPLLMIFTANRNHSGHYVKVYRLNIERREWERVENIGRRALFVSYHGCIQSDNPTMWGGNENCIYYGCRKTGATHSLSLSKEDPSVEMLLSEFCLRYRNPYLISETHNLVNWI